MPDGNLTGPGDLAAQARSSRTWDAPSAPPGARPDQVAKITIYAGVQDTGPEFLPVIERARLALFGGHKQADTIVGVAALSQPGYLIEVDAMAVA